MQLAMLSAGGGGGVGVKHLKEYISYDKFVPKWFLL